MVDQVAAAATRFGQCSQVSVGQAGLGRETQGAVSKPTKSLTLGDHTLCQLGRCLAARADFCQMRRGDGVQFMIDRADLLLQPIQFLFKP
jgi:hypothetical protein